MIEFYPQIKLVHVVCVLLSGALFFLRGSLVLAGSRFGMAAPLRYLSYSIDTALLTAALMLWTILPGGLFANGWLTTKILLLVVYIVLGSFALKRARSRRARVLCFIAALAVYAFMFSVARAHHPAGLFWSLLG
jgi:uncharacterized membrane protein SirB2